MVNMRVGPWNRNGHGSCDMYAWGRHVWDFLWHLMTKFEYTAVYTCFRKSLVAISSSILRYKFVWFLGMECAKYSSTSSSSSLSSLIRPPRVGHRLPQKFSIHPCFYPVSPSSFLLFFLSWSTPSSHLTFSLPIPSFPSGLPKIILFWISFVVRSCHMPCPP